jgi:hypothetical protein
MKIMGCFDGDFVGAASEFGRRQRIMALYSDTPKEVLDRLHGFVVPAGATCYRKR